MLKDSWKEHHLAPSLANESHQALMVASLVWQLEHLLDVVMVMSLVLVKD